MVPSHQISASQVSPAQFQPYFRISPSRIRFRDSACPPTRSLVSFFSVQASKTTCTYCKTKRRRLRWVPALSCNLVSQHACHLRAPSSFLLSFVCGKVENVMLCVGQVKGLTLGWIPAWQSRQSTRAEPLLLCLHAGFMSRAACRDRAYTEGGIWFTVIQIITCFLVAENLFTPRGQFPGLDLHCTY